MTWMTYGGPYGYLDEYSTFGPGGIVPWVAKVLSKAIEFAREEKAKEDKARTYNLDCAVERGTCAIGHPFRTEPGRNFDGQHPCGYCESAIEHDQAVTS